MLRRLVWVGVACVVSALPAAADYLIQPGDVLGFMVIGAPDLSTRATVDNDGTVVLPLAGAVPVAGVGLTDAQRRIQDALATKSLNRQTEDGRQVPVVITPAQVNVSIAEYRPVYVDGDVAKPGAVAFRPGLTVRQALALVGGMGLGQAKQPGALADTANLTQVYNELSVTSAKTQLEIARLDAEIAGRTSIDPKLAEGLPVSPRLRDELLANEQQLLAAHQQEFTGEQGYLAGAAKREEERADILHQQQQKDDEGVKIDEADLARLQELFKKGAIALPTLSEARRSVLQSSTRALQTTATLGSVQRERGELGRRYDRLADTRRSEILKSLSEASAKLALTRAQQQGVADRLRQAGLRPQLGPASDEKVKVAITRLSRAGAPTTIDASLDTELQPGDALTVALPSFDAALGQ